MAEHIIFAEDTAKPLLPTNGSAGIATQLPGCATTVGNIASATGGISPGNIVSTDK